MLPIHELAEFPGYGVTANGAVWSRRRKGQWRELATWESNQGYSLVCFMNNGVKHRRLVHRLIASEFIRPIQKGMEVNHVNGIKQDNRIENLEIVTSSENSSHAIASGLQKAKSGKDHGMAKLTDSEVLEIFGMRTTSIPQHEIAKQYGVTQTAISHIFLRKRWAHLTENA